MKRRIAKRTIGSLILASALAVGFSCSHVPLKESAQVSAREVKTKKVKTKRYELLRCFSSAPRDCPKEIAQHKAMVGIKKEFCRMTKQDATRMARGQLCGPLSKLQMTMKLDPDGVIKVVGTQSESGGCSGSPGAGEALRSVSDDVRLPPSKGCRFVLEAYFREKQ